MSVGTDDRQPRRVMIVEDDAAIAEGLALNLKLQGFATEVIGDGETAHTRIEASLPDLVLLDISLPKKSGIWVLENLRQSGNNVPVIVLSARQNEFDKVAALHLGADDYVTKPFALAELLARITTLLRRARLNHPPSSPKIAPPNGNGLKPEGSQPGGEEESILRFGAVEINLQTRSVVRDDQPIKLTHLEFELLRFLCQSGGRVFSREELVRQVWGIEHAGQGRTVDNFIAQLRAKLEKNPNKPKHLLTIRGSGYRFDV